jgi:lipopolysaccharide export system permease protein
VKIIYRYLIGAIARGYLLVAASLLALFGLFEFIDRAGDVGRAEFEIIDAVLVVALTLPARLVDLSPFVALLGVVYGLASFVRSQELIAMRTVGLAPLRLAVLSGVATLLFFAVMAVVELVARPMAQQSHLLHMTQTSPDGTLFAADGIWIQQDGLFVNIESLARGGAPTGIRMYEFGNDATLRRFLHSSRADLHSAGAWELRDVLEKRYTGDTVETETHTTLPWTPPWRHSATLYELPVESLSLQEVNRQRIYLAQEQRPDALYALEFWRRLLTPLSGLVFTLFAAPFVLGVGPRASTGGAVTLGVAIALVIFLVQQISTNAIFLATQSAPLAVILPPLLVLGAAALMIRRVNGGPR